MEENCAALTSKNKGDIQSCDNYRGIKLMRYTLKLWERVVEAGQKSEFVQQYGFMPTKEYYRCSIYSEDVNRSTEKAIGSCIVSLWK